MRITSALPLLFSLFCSYALADNEPAGGDRVTPLVPPEETWEPSAVPDRIVLSWESDPATSMSVTWRTGIATRHAVAEIGPAEDGPKFLSKTTSHDARTESLATDLGGSLRHSVTFTGLHPATKYLYRVGDGTNWSEWADFQTAAASEAPFSFVYFGDAQNDLKSHWSRVIRRAFRDEPNAHFFLHAGDLINRAESDAEWGEWFYAGGFINRSIPCVATPGNHEFGRISEGSDQRRLSIHWQPSFAFPQNGPDGLKETVYYFDYQGTRFVSLNSNEKIEEQAVWLEQVLSTNHSRWTVLTFHHPIYSASAGRDNPQLRAIWQPVIDRHKVDLVLQGHDHTYARSQLMTAETNLNTGAAHLDPYSGTVYVVSVSGPKMYELGRRPFMRRAAEDTQLFQIITIDGAELKYEARTATGDLYDAFVLGKDEEGRRVLTEKIPDSEENRRPESERTKQKPKTAQETVTEWLATLDKDGNGKLDRDEFPPEYRPFFVQIDADGDGTCSEEELLTAVKTLAGK